MTVNERVNKDIEISFYSDGSNNTIGGVTAISAPELTSDRLETTPYSSSMYREYIQGLKDIGEITVTVNFDTSNNATNYHADLVGLYETGTDVSWNIDFPDDAKLVFYGFVMSYSPNPAIGEVYTADITIAPSNSTAPTWTDAT